jgi:hypothetical protein
MYIEYLLFLTFTLILPIGFCVLMLAFFLESFA